MFICLVLLLPDTRGLKDISPTAYGHSLPFLFNIEQYSPSYYCLLSIIQLLVLDVTVSGFSTPHTRIGAQFVLIH